MDGFGIKIFRGRQHLIRLHWLHLGEDLEEVEYELIRIHLEERFRKQLKDDIKWKYSQIFNGTFIVNGFRAPDGTEVGLIVLRWDGKIKDYVSQWYDFEDRYEVIELIEEEKNKQCLDPDMVRMAFHLHMDKKFNSNKEETEETEIPSMIPKGTLLS